MTYSPGWGADVTLGTAQERMRARLARSVRHPSRTWHDAPPLRALDPSPGTARRTLHRLRALGVVALQKSLRGCKGGTRFTFGVRKWRSTVISRGGLARMVPPPMRRAAPGQLTLSLTAGLPRAPVVRAGPSLIRDLVAAAVGGITPPTVALAHHEPAMPPPPGVAPTLVGACVRCGDRAQVRMGVYVDDAGRYAHGIRCVDHDACDARRAR